jgi:hypothetical protein
MPKVHEPSKVQSNCPAEQAASVRSLVRAELARIGERFDAADRRAHQAAVRGNTVDRAAAEAERDEAAGDFWSASMELADLCLLLLRYATDYRPEALQQYLAKALRAELEPLAEAIAKLEHALCR